MLYNLVERAEHGNKQINRVDLPYDLDCSRWENTSQLFREGKISKAIADKYKYITTYNPVDWVEEEKDILTESQYILT